MFEQSIAVLKYALAVGTKIFVFQECEAFVVEERLRGLIPSIEKLCAFIWQAIQGEKWREPTERDYELSIAAKRLPRELWLSDLMWAYLNQLKFIFNH